MNVMTKCSSTLWSRSSALILFFSLLSQFLAIKKTRFLVRWQSGYFQILIPLGKKDLFMENFQKKAHSKFTLCIDI